MSQNSNQNDAQKEFFDSLDNFKEAVFNGQVRLALEHLLPVIDGIVDVLSSEEEEPVQKVVAEDKAKAEVATPAAKEDQKAKKATTPAAPEASVSAE